MDFPQNTESIRCNPPRASQLGLIPLQYSNISIFKKMFLINSAITTFICLPVDLRFVTLAIDKCFSLYWRVARDPSMFIHIKGPDSPDKIINPLTMVRYSTSATANFCRYSTTRLQFAQFLVLSCTVVALIYSSADYLSKIWPYALYKVPEKPLVNCNAKTASTDDRHCLRLLFVAHFICNGCHISRVVEF